jgi:flagellar hook-basal body complex protein FliE
MSIGSIHHAELAAAAQSPQKPKSAAGGEAFAEALENGVQKVNAEVKNADNSVQQMVESRGANLHEAMIALERADIAARFTSKVGQKLVQAYQEVSRMQV